MTEKADQNSTPKKSRMRSPAYPSLSLSEAVEKAQQLWNTQKTHESHIDSAIVAIGYSKPTGVSLRAISALNQYGLIIETGSKSDRRIRVSELAKDILILQDSDNRYIEALKEAALKPTIHAHLWGKYRPILPADSVMTPYLIRDKNFNEMAVRKVLKNFRNSVEYAKIDKLDNIDGEDEGNQSELDDFSTESGGSPTMTTATEQAPPQLSPEASQSLDELPVMVGDGKIARIPYPMTSKYFDLLIGALNLYRDEIVRDELEEE